MTRRSRSPRGQQELEFRTWGGARPGAGRPPKHRRSSEPHKQRPRLRASEPVHVVIRVEPDLGNLRTRAMYLAIREATITSVLRDDFRIVHLSVQGTHVHVIVEADSRLALARGMQGFQISAAKHLNAAAATRLGKPRRGRVFVDRYHARILSSPRAVRHAVAYVLNNWRHHGEDRAPVARTWRVDPFSSGVRFAGWHELADSPILFKPPSTYQQLATWLPKTWLLREAWQRHGRVSVHEVPGPRPVRAKSR